jgi:hypothetical protein
MRSAVGRSAQHPHEVRCRQNHQHHDTNGVEQQREHRAPRVGPVAIEHPKQSIHERPQHECRRNDGERRKEKSGNTLSNPRRGGADVGSRRR